MCLPDKSLGQICITEVLEVDIDIGVAVGRSSCIRAVVDDNNIKQSGYYPYKLLAMPTAQVARMLTPLAFSTGYQLVGGIAPKPPLSSLHSSISVFILLYSSHYRHVRYLQ